MFYASKSQVNPASAGFFKGDYQLFTNYRTQWGKNFINPYNTISVSFDSRLSLKNNFFGYGINVYKDISGISSFTVNQISIPINYSIKINRKHFFSLGFTPMFYQRYQKNLNLNWQNQWTGSGYNQGIFSGESLIQNNFNYSKIDMGSGMFWQTKNSKYSWFSFGVAVHHILNPSISSLSNISGSYRQFSFTFYGHFNNQNSNLTFKPNLLVTSQGPNLNIILGSGLDFKIKNQSLYTNYHHENSIEFGMYYRYLDAVIFNSIYHLAQLNIGLSFDITTSNLSRYTKGYGALEMFIAFKFNKPTGYGAVRIH
jgi:type IX secretion system PorP/SprF family membrane protein